MKDPVMRGHPLHAMLSALPIGMTVAGVSFDILHATGLFLSMPWEACAQATLGAAFLSGCITALVGLWDYQAVPREHPVRKTGALHGYLNGAALLFLALSCLYHWQGSFSALSLIFSLLALVGIILAGWFGGELVFTLGWRVTPAEHAQLLEEALHQQQQDALIEKAHTVVQQYRQEHTLLP